jgi:hypothetical protein
VFLLSGDEDDEVVGVTDESVVRQALAASFLSLLLDSHCRLPVPDEVVVQHGQGDVGQQRGEDSSNAVGNFCFEVSLGYRRVERPRRVSKPVGHVK